MDGGTSVKRWVVLVLLPVLLLSGCAIREVRLPPLRVGILEEIAPMYWNRDRLKSLPAFDPRSAEPWQVDLRGYDLTPLDLSGRFGDLRHADFDLLTKWPETLPKTFDVNKVMELGKNPGLGVRSLHERGVTGKGVAIGIIDQTLLPGHVEYRDQLRHYEHIEYSNHRASMHGPAVASIAVGKTVGVAPEADLYYIAATGSVTWGFPWLRYDRYTWTYRAQAIERLLDINETLPPEKRIRVISISWGAGRTVDGYDKLVAAIDRAKENGVFVITCSISEFYGMSYMGLGRDPFLDPDDPESYRVGQFLEAQGFGQSTMTPDQADRIQSWLFIPMDSRCTASPTGPNDYAFYASGGLSWSAPYLAGLYALACQVKPDVTPEDFWEAASTTATVLPFGHVVDPVKLIEEVKRPKEGDAGQGLVFESGWGTPDEGVGP
jgi:hypothetical protein